MKYLYTLFFLVTLTTISFSQRKDSVFCLPKKDVLILANKIQSLQDTAKYRLNVVNAQSRLIVALEDRICVFGDQLKNRQETIDFMDKKTKELEKQIESLRPKWYDDNRLWFTSGIVITSLMFILSK